MFKNLFKRKTCLVCHSQPKIKESEILDLCSKHKKEYVVFKFKEKILGIGKNNFKKYYVVGIKNRR